MPTLEPGTERERAYMRGMSSIYQTYCIVNSATATAGLMESDLVTDIEVDDTIEVYISFCIDIV